MKHRVALCLVVLIVLGLSGTVGRGHSPAGANAAHASFILPFDPGQTFYVCQGYHSTFTHANVFALDLTAGSTCDATAATGRNVRAPFSGTVVKWESSRGELCVKSNDGYAIRLTHINASQGWAPGNAITQDQVVGTIAGPTDPVGNNGTAHLHIELWNANACFSGSTLPFAGDAALSGTSLPDNGQRNVVGGQYKGTALTRNQPPDPDPDNDGIPNSVDQCDNEPENYNDYQDTDGCPDQRPIGSGSILRRNPGLNLAIIYGGARFHLDEDDCAELGFPNFCAGRFIDVSAAQFDAYSTIPYDGTILRRVPGLSLDIIFLGTRFHLDEDDCNELGFINFCAGRFFDVPAEEVAAISPVPPDGTIWRGVPELSLDIVYGGARFHLDEPDCEELGFPSFCAGTFFDVPSEEIAAWPLVPANGTLLREVNSSDVYLMCSGIARYVHDLAEYSLSSGAVRAVPAGAMAQIPIGDRALGEDACNSDEDGDSFPDQYVSFHACMRVSTADPHGFDFDGDRVSNLVEFQSSLSPCDSDVDEDGCVDGLELPTINANPNTGGDRDPHVAWDFYDVNADRAIDLQDALAILDRFGAVSGNPDYDPAFDRYAPDPSKSWRTAPASNGLDLEDVLLNLQSFGHKCRRPADFDEDGVVGCWDARVILNGWGSNLGLFDLDRSGRLFARDLEIVANETDAGQECLKSADLNGNGLVSQADLDILVGLPGFESEGCWEHFAGRPVSAYNPCDINGDLFVNSADLAILLTKWGTGG